MEKKNCEGWFRVNGASLKGHNGLTSCTFFHEWNEWKNVQRVRPLWPWKKATFTRIQLSQVFLFHSVTNISINVRTFMSLIFQVFMKSIDLQWPYWPLCTYIVHFYAYTTYIKSSKSNHFVNGSIAHLQSVDLRSEWGGFESCRRRYHFLGSYAQKYKFLFINWGLWWL